MREIRKSGSMRGNWKHALLARNGLLWQEEPRLGGAPVPYSTRLPPALSPRSGSLQIGFWDWLLAVGGLPVFRLFVG